MLGTSVKLAEKYNYLEEKFKIGYEFLQRSDLKDLPDGPVTLGSGVVASVQSYTTVPSDTAKFETHDKFFDIQFIISGEEHFEVADRSSLDVETPYDAQKDITFYREPAHKSTLYLKAGDLAVVAPEDAHKPRCSAGVASAVKKVVIKVPV